MEPNILDLHQQRCPMALYLLNVTAQLEAGDSGNHLIIDSSSFKDIESHLLKRVRIYLCQSVKCDGYNSLIVVKETSLHVRNGCRWYQTAFPDPHAVSLVAILSFGFHHHLLFRHPMAPLFVAIVLAYLLEWRLSNLLPLEVPPRTLARLFCHFAFCRCDDGLCWRRFPTIWDQVANLVADIPKMYNGLQS